MHLQLWLVRHGETEWSASGQHTGRTDLPLTLQGKLHARQIAGFLGGRAFALVLTSPLQRARETCQLAGYGDSAIIDANLRQWDYGEYEGRTTPQIQIERPGWSLWRDGVIGGERIEQVAARAQKVIDRAAASLGDVLVFAHGHILRVLSARWLGLPPEAGRLFALGTASVSILAYEHDTRVITEWNGGAKGRARPRIKMASPERSNQSTTEGSEKGATCACIRGFRCRPGVLGDGHRIAQMRIFTVFSGEATLASGARDQNN